MKSTLIALAAASVSLAVATPSFAKSADCSVVRDGSTLTRGICDFDRAGPNGSFQLSFPSGKALLGPGVAYVTVKISRAGVGVAYAMLESGRYVRWGVVTRGADRACWVGDGLRICAR